MYFEFEKLDVYKVTLEFVAAADDIAESLPKGRRYLKDQLRRGANSIAANLAEGVGEYSSAEKVRFYRMSRRSAVECASHLLACRRLALVEDELIARGLDLLLRIVAMQTSMIKSISAKTCATR
jgi:four helix bundle protein